MKLRLLAFLPLLAACTARPPQPPPAPPPPPIDTHVPDYAKRPYEPFARSNAVGIALREWRAFGSVVNDSTSGLAPPRALRPDQQPGLWQRVGDYWWISENFAAPGGAWTSRHDAFGNLFEGNAPAWSAAFISYVMRTAGAGDRFPYSALHADYINAAARNEAGVRAERTDTYPPQPGDLICLGRADARNLTFEDLPANRFLGHCDIVVDAAPGQLRVVGGNVAGGVTLRHVPTTTAGLVSDPRFRWIVVIRVLFDN